MRKIIRNLYLHLNGSYRDFAPGIHILSSHFVTPGFSKSKDSELFEKYLLRLKNKSILIDIQQATHFVVNNCFPKNECLVALTFDDGFDECHSVIAPLLEKHNCRAAFFINANYIDSNKTYQHEFHHRINTLTKTPMSWQQVTELHHHGHVIGTHTLDHLNLSKLNEDEINFQLEKNKHILEDKLNYSCDYFAWTFGRMVDFPETALEYARKYHRFIFSSANYKHYFSYNGLVINRRHIEPYWPASHINYFLSTPKSV